MTSSRQLSRRTACLIAATIFAITTGETSAQAADDMPPPIVGVVKLKARPIPVMSELPGRIAATRISEVRARVSGILLERVFEQGSLVKQGDVLYRIDPRLFKVRVASAEASLQKAEAVQANAKQQFDRQKALRERNVSSENELDKAAVSLAQADADVGLAKAALDEAKINLEYTDVRAPITGIIGGALVTEGTLVTADGISNLALIQQIDPVYADFTQSAQELRALKRDVSDGKLDSPTSGEARVELVFDGGDHYDQPGKLLFANASVDSTTGQIMLRAEFPNFKGDLLPGMYVRVRIEQAVQQGAITVPQRSVTRTPSGKAQVFVVDADHAVETRDITLGAAVGAEWLVTSGLKDGEVVVADGVQKVQPGIKVNPEAWISASNAQVSDPTIK